MLYAANQDDRYLVSALYLGFDPGLQETWYSGSMARLPNAGERTSVAAACVEASSAYTPDPCQLELLVLERGTAETIGAAGATSEVEVGSRVRLRVMCPNGLYSPAGDDHGAWHYDITPSEFELEAHDCTVED